LGNFKAENAEHDHGTGDVARDHNPEDGAVQLYYIWNVEENEVVGAPFLHNSESEFIILEVNQVPQELGLSYIIDSHLILQILMDVI